MTGKIKSLSVRSPSGVITADNGLNLYFDAWAVWPDRGAGLAIGQIVSFDLEGSQPPMAVNVRSMPQHEPARRPSKGHSDVTHFQYIGFQHVGSVRAYRFNRIAQGEETRQFVVNADLALFAKYHVAIQEGPALCLHLLLSAPVDIAGASAEPSQSLTDQDMVAHLARRPVPAARSGPKRNRVISNVSSAAV